MMLAISKEAFPKFTEIFTHPVSQETGHRKKERRKRRNGKQRYILPDMHPADVHKFCDLDETGQALMQTAMNQLHCRRGRITGY